MFKRPSTALAHGIGASGGGPRRSFRAPKILQEALGEIDATQQPSTNVEPAQQQEHRPATEIDAAATTEPPTTMGRRMERATPPKVGGCQRAGGSIEDDASTRGAAATAAPADRGVVPKAATTAATANNASKRTSSFDAYDEEYALMREAEEDRRRSIDIGFTLNARSAEKLGPNDAGIPLTPPAFAAPTPEQPNFYGLPLAAKRMYGAMGVTKLYDWQHEVLTREDVRQGHNFIYSLPTSGGKTLVAEILLLRSVLQRTKSAMLVLPFVSIAEEKTASLQPFAAHFGFPVEGYYGTNGRFPLPHAAAIYVCTIEKANSLLNHLFEEGRQAELGCVVVDELHMVGEPRRGGTLELFLTKLLAACKETQIIGMSATVPNLDVLATWLRASSYVCEFRPVPLKEYSVCDGIVMEGGITQVRSLASCGSDHEALLCLVGEDPEGSTLVFCASRQSTMDTAKQIARGLVRLYNWPVRPYAKQMLEELRALGHDDQSALAETIAVGVAYHHAGLLMEERTFIERCYRAKQITILCCTSTLAAGVNLPARRVVFRTPYMGREFLAKSRYLQMCGRAGRAGLDAFGESYLILSKRDRANGQALMRRGTEDSRSALLFPSTGATTSPPGAGGAEEQPLTRALLECIGVGMLASVGAAIDFAKTLLCYVERVTECAGSSGSRGAAAGTDNDPTSLLAVDVQVFAHRFEETVQEALLALERLQLITIQAPPAVELDGGGAGSTADGTASLPLGGAATLPSTGVGRPLDFAIGATPFGISAVRSCFGIEEAVMIRDELAILQETGVILSDDLHLCYFLTPIREVMDCDWGCYQRILNRMNDTRQRITDALGVNEYFVDQCAMGVNNGLVVQSPVGASPFMPNMLLSDPSKRELFTTKRFYVAMMLSDLLNEVPMATLEVKYKVNRGQLQSLLKSASMFSSSITSFCNAMNWFSLEALLASFVKRLGFGVRPDIVPLMEIKGVQPSRARALWNAGFRDPASIAAASPADLVARVKASNPPDSKAAKFFAVKSAVFLVREATRHLQQVLRDKRGELMELTFRGTQSQPAGAAPAALRAGTGTAVVRRR